MFGHFGMRHDGGVVLVVEQCVPARVITVIVGVDDIKHRLFGQAGYGGAQFVIDRGELGIDHQHALAAHRDGGVAAGAGDVIDPLAQIGHFLFDFGIIGPLGEHGRTAGEHGQQAKGGLGKGAAHEFPP